MCSQATARTVIKQVVHETKTRIVHEPQKSPCERPDANAKTDPDTDLKTIDCDLGDANEHLKTPPPPSSCKSANYNGTCHTTNNMTVAALGGKETEPSCVDNCTTGTPPPVDCTKTPKDPSCTKTLMPSTTTPITKTCPDGSVIDASANCQTQSTPPTNPNTPFTPPSTSGTPPPSNNPSPPSSSNNGNPSGGSSNSNGGEGDSKLAMSEPICKSCPDMDIHGLNTCQSFYTLKLLAFWWEIEILIISTQSSDIILPLVVASFENLSRPSSAASLYLSYFISYISPHSRLALITERNTLSKAITAF
jgi:hypothetical protein